MEEGTAYRGRQGTGFATVLGPSRYAEDLVARQQAAMEGKAKERAGAVSKMQEVKPDEVWHYYSAEANNRWEKWMQKGAELMTDKGIDNPWKSSDPTAVQWQIEGARLKQGVDNIKQAQDLYNKSMDAIAVRGDKYDEGYIKSVSEFPKQYSFDDVASGKFEFPKASFKDPGEYYSKFLIKDSKALKESLPQGTPPTDAQLLGRVQMFFQSPDNEAERTSAMQMYDALPQPLKDKYISIAERKGLDEPWQALSYENYRAQFMAAPSNVMDDVMKYAKVAPKDYNKWVKEDTSGVTRAGAAERLANKDYPAVAAKSHFNEKSYLLDDEGYMDSLGVDINQPRAQRRAAAEKAFAAQVLANTPLRTESSLTREGDGLGEKELQDSWNVWRQRIGGEDPVEANEAANWLFASNDPLGSGNVSKAQVVMPSLAQRAAVGGGPVKLIAVTYTDDKSAKTAREKVLKEKMWGAPEDAGPDQQAAWEQLISTYEQRYGGNTVIFAITPENEQRLKELHDRSARMRKQEYKPIYSSEGSLDMPGQTKAATPGAGALDAPPNF